MKTQKEIKAEIAKCEKRLTDLDEQLDHPHKRLSYSELEDIWEEQGLLATHIALLNWVIS